MKLSDGVITVLLLVVIYLLLRADDGGSLARVTTPQSKYCYEATQAPTSLVNIVMYDSLKKCKNSKKLYSK